MIDDLMLIHDDNKAGSGSSAENTLDLKKLFLENIQSAAIDSSADEMKLLPFSRPGGFSKGLNFHGFGIRCSAFFGVLKSTALSLFVDVC